MNDCKLAGCACAEKLEKHVVAVLTMGYGASSNAEKAMLLGTLSRKLLV
jgi:hypothetical protein